MQSSILSIYLTGLSLLAHAAAQHYPLPVPCTGAACQNPPHTLHYQDFSVIRRETDGQYFRFSKSNSSGHGLSVATAPKLRGPWNYRYEILTVLNESYVTNRSDADVWAPDVKFINNQYYMFYSIHTGMYSDPHQTFDLCVATSPNMSQGSWTDHGSMGAPAVHNPSKYVRLDGNLIANSSNPTGVADGRPYMAFGSQNWGLYGFQVSDDYTKIAAGASVDLVIADQLNPADDVGNRTAGPYQLVHGSHIYMFYSMGNCCPPARLNETASVYHVLVCRTSVGTPKGPYLDKAGKDCAQAGNGAGTVVLASQPDGSVFAPGSVGVLDDPDEGGLVMYYQYYNVSGVNEAGLRFGFNYLEFAGGDDGWPVLVAQRSS